MPLPFIIPFLFGVGVGITGALTYAASKDFKPFVKKDGNVIHINPKSKKPKGPTGRDLPG